MTKFGLRDENTRAATLPLETQASSVQELRAEVTDAADALMGLQTLSRHKLVRLDGRTHGKGKSNFFRDPPESKEKKAGVDPFP